jgi:DNA-binding transcriptional MocR family regulator
MTAGDAPTWKMDDYKERGTLNMIILKLDRKRRQPLHKQVFDQLRKMIDRNILAPGTRLPSTRTLAFKHGISRTTVLKAYEELWGRGYLESRPGSYTTVRAKTPCCTPVEMREKSLIDWNGSVSPASRTLYETVSRFPQSGYLKPSIEMLDMAALDIDHRILPIEDFKRCLTTVVVEDTKIFNYGTAEGDMDLRESISARLNVHGIYCDPDEVLITNGSQQSLDLIVRFFAHPEATIITESPTYMHAMPLIRFQGAYLTDVEIGPKGIDLHSLEEKLERNKPEFIYTMPNFQNPTGITMCQSVREDLLSIAERYRVPIVEDAFEEEMKYFGKVPMPIKSMDKNGVVIYMSSFSKVLFPGIRTGWIAADRDFIRRITALKRVTDLSSNSVIQSAMNEFISRGYYDLHIRRMHRIFKKRMLAMIEALQSMLPGDHISWREPTGGYLVWLRLKGLKASEDELHAELRKHGVAASRGSQYFPRPPKDHYLRLSISKLDEKEIVEGVRRVGKALGRLYRKRPGRTARSTKRRRGRSTKQ